MEYKVDNKIVAKVVNDAFSPGEGMKRYYLTIKTDLVETIIAADAVSKGHLKHLADLIIEKQYPTGKLHCIERQGSITKYYQK